jgi:hypothetical protein
MLIFILIVIEDAKKIYGFFQKINLLSAQLIRNLPTGEEFFIQ